MDCRFLLQGIFLPRGSNPGLLHCRQTFYHLSHQESPRAALFLSISQWNSYFILAISLPVIFKCFSNTILIRPTAFPGDSDSKGSACNAGDTGDPGSISGLGRSPGESNGYPLQYSCLENSMEKSLVGYSQWGLKESDTTEWLTQFICPKSSILLEKVHFCFVSVVLFCFLISHAIATSNRDGSTLYLISYQLPLNFCILFLILVSSNNGCTGLNHLKDKPNQYSTLWATSQACTVHVSGLFNRCQKLPFQPHENGGASLDIKPTNTHTKQFCKKKKKRKKFFLTFFGLLNFKRQPQLHSLFYIFFPFSFTISIEVSFSTSF